MPDESIRIITDEIQNVSETSGEKAAWDIGSNWNIEVKTKALPKNAADVSISKLEQEMTRFMQDIDGLFSRAEKQADMKYMQLDEIELAVEINGEGQVSLFGAGAKIGGKQGITLRFKRRA
ncbi:hypothetical protein [Anabaena azotica]|uniref:Pepco domain-containing protein n=1 Tax=Anabaena azotica TaxID=197653 RepID=UPI0039A6D994